VKTLLVWLAFLGFIPGIILAMAKGTISMEAGVVALLLFVVGIRFGIKNLAAKIAAPIAGVVLLASQFSHGDVHEYWTIFTGVMSLSIVMFGFYVMIGGLSKRGRSDDSN
jgi:general stress protein CsbA